MGTFPADLSSEHSDGVTNVINNQVLLGPRQKRFVTLFLVMLIVAFTPSKALGQFSALIFLMGLIFFVTLLPQRHVAKYLFVIFLYSSVGLFYYVAMPEFSFVNYYLFFLTASSFLILLYDFRSIVNEHLLRKLSSVTLVFAVFQSLVAIVQGLVGVARTGTFDRATGDFVRGTLELSFTPAGSGSNPIFAILMSILFLFIFATSTGVRIPLRLAIAYFVILLALLMASVMHAILFFTSAVIMSYPLLLRVNVRKKVPPLRKQKKRKGIIFTIVTITLLIAVFIRLVLPRNLSTLPYFINVTLNIGSNVESYKARATYNTLFFLRRDVAVQPLFGLGPGQYSSRASLMRTGEYLRINVPLSTYVSEMADKYILSLWRNFPIRYPQGGSTFFPFYSWLSLYGEMGLVGILLATLLLRKGFVTFRRIRSSKFPRMNLAMLSLMFYLALLGLQDNYWEFTQAVFPAFLILSLCCAYLRREALSVTGESSSGKRLRFQ